MQKILCFLLLAAGITCGQSAMSQFPGAGLPESPYSFKPNMQKAFAWPSPPSNAGIGRSPFLRSSTAGKNSVRILSPDRMPCRIPDLTLSERMPVRQLSNINPSDRMPNGWRGRKTVN